MTTCTDDGQHEQDTKDTAHEAGASKAAGIVSLPRNTPNIEPPTLEPPHSDRIEPLLALPAPAARARLEEEIFEPERPETIDIEVETVVPERETPRRSYRFALLAASVAVAAVLGSLAGSLATGSLSALIAKKAPSREAATGRVLKETIAQLQAELTSLKATIEAVNRTSTAQYARIGERFDRIERAQNEPAAKLNKIAEQLDRLERRPVAPAAPADTTGSISESRPAPAAQPPAPAPAEAKPAKPVIVDGWILVGVYRGRALVESRYGEFEAVPGANLPGLGQVQDVVRQDGHWVVVTQKGLITSVR
jgi:hypothetical protein